MRRGTSKGFPAASARSCNISACTCTFTCTCTLKRGNHHRGSRRAGSAVSACPLNLSRHRGSVIGHWTRSTPSPSRSSTPPHQAAGRGRRSGGCARASARRPPSRRCRLDRRSGPSRWQEAARGRGGSAGGPHSRTRKSSSSAFPATPTRTRKTSPRGG